MNTTQPITITAPSQESPARCQHRTLKGRCRQPATDSAGTLCFNHARAQRQAKDDFTLLEPLVRKLDDFQSIHGINEHLAALQNLLAEGRISPRRASVIAYIDSLLLRTVVETEHQDEREAKSNLNYYGAPITPFDYSSLAAPPSDLTGAPLPDAGAVPSSIPATPASALAEKNPATYNPPHTESRG